MADVAEEKKMDVFTACMLCEGVEEGTEEEVVAAWQYLYDQKAYMRLQGFYGRQMDRMLRDGVIHD